MIMILSPGGQKGVGDTFDSNVICILKIGKNSFIDDC